MWNPQLNFVNFFKFFSDKVLAIRSSFVLQSSDLSLFSLASPASLSCFQSVSLRELCDLVNKMKKNYLFT